MNAAPRCRVGLHVVSHYLILSLCDKLISILSHRFVRRLVSAEFPKSRKASQNYRLFRRLPTVGSCWNPFGRRHARLHELQAPKLGEEACMLIRVSHHTPRLKPSCPAAEILPRTRPQLQGPPWMRQGSTERERERHHESECATCSIISVLTQWGATLVIQLRERERRERETIAANLFSLPGLSTAPAIRAVGTCVTGRSPYSAPSASVDGGIEQGTSISHPVARRRHRRSAQGPTRGGTVLC